MGLYEYENQDPFHPDKWKDENVKEYKEAVFARISQLLIEKFTEIEPYIEGNSGIKSLQKTIRNQEIQVGIQSEDESIIIYQSDTEANVEDKDIIDEKILDFKKSMKKVAIHDIALPTGVKRLTKFADKRNKRGAIFTPMHKGTPVHVKAAWMYNDLLDYYKLENVEKIKNSEKIKWVYLKSNSLEVKQIAFKGYDDPKEILDFIREHIDYDKLFERALQKKIRIFYEALDWDMPIDKINTLARFI